MTDLTTATAAELAGRIASREVSSEEVTRAYLDRISEVDGEINAFLHVGADAALEAARAVDTRLAAGEKLGPLAGVVGREDLGHGHPSVRSWTGVAP